MAKRKRPDLDESLDLPVPKIKLVHPPVKVSKPKRAKGQVTALLYGDTHIPFQDTGAVEVVRQVAVDLQPDIVVHMGDLLDAYNISRFERDPRLRVRLQDEIDMAVEHLASMTLATPKARRIFLEGNHCDRLRRTIWGMQGSERALVELDSVQEALTWPRLLSLDEVGWEFVPYFQQPLEGVLPKFLLKHGTVIRSQAAYTARAEWERYGKSGASGHSHRQGMFMHSDYNGTHHWFEVGCTCDLNPTWAPGDQNWQQGALVLTFDEATGALSPEPVKIHKGEAFFRGKWYRG